MRKPIVVVVAAVALCGTAARSVQAEPFVVVAPSNFFFAPDGDGFRLTGRGFHFLTEGFLAIQATAGGGCLGTDPVGSRFNCTAGDRIDMSVRTPGEVSMGAGTATIYGVTHRDVSFFGDFDFTAVPSLFPASSEASVFFHQPFVFRGTLRGMVNGSEVFNVDLTGTGTTARAFYRTPDGTYNYQMESDTSYAFDDEIVPTPEPASLLLLGSGLAGLVARARRRRAEFPPPA